MFIKGHTDLVLNSAFFRQGQIKSKNKALIIFMKNREEIEFALLTTPHMICTNCFSCYKFH